MAEAAPQRRDNLLGQVRARRAGMRDAIGHVEAAASAPAPGREADWRGGVAQALTRLRTAFESHIEVTESDGGVFDEVIEEAPRLAKKVERLHAEHENISAALSAVDAHLSKQDDVDDVREAVFDLLGALARHRHRGADLLHEAFVVDISVGD